MSPDGYKGATKNRQSTTVIIYWLLILQICFFKHEHMRYSVNGAQSALANPNWRSASQSLQSPADFSCFPAIPCISIRDQRWEHRAGLGQNRALCWGYSGEHSCLPMPSLLLFSYSLPLNKSIYLTVLTLILGSRSVKLYTWCASYSFPYRY